jgi:hypothetical protein
LPATGTALAALELRHNGRNTAHGPRGSWTVELVWLLNYLTPSCFSTKSPTTGNL